MKTRAELQVELDCIERQMQSNRRRLTALGRKIEAEDGSSMALRAEEIRSLSEDMTKIWDRWNRLNKEIEEWSHIRSKEGDSIQ